MPDLWAQRQEISLQRTGGVRGCAILNPSSESEFPGLGGGRAFKCCWVTASPSPECVVPSEMKAGILHHATREPCCLVSPKLGITFFCAVEILLLEAVEQPSPAFGLGRPTLPRLQNGSVAKTKEVAH